MPHKFPLTAIAKPLSLEQTPQVRHSLLTLLSLGKLLTLSERRSSKIHLLLLKRKDLLLEAIRHDKLLHLDVSGLADTVNTVDGLHLQTRIELRLHDVDLVGGGKVETLTTGFDRDEAHHDGGIFAELLENASACWY